MLMIMAMLALTFTFIEYIYFQSTTQAFNKGKTKFNVKFSANLYHGDIMPKCGFLQGGSPICQRDFCFTHLSGDDLTVH